MTSEDDSKEYLLREIEQLKSENIKLKSALDDVSQKNIELQAYRNNLELLLDSAKFAWWQLNLENNEIQYSPLKAQMLGFSPGFFFKYPRFQRVAASRRQESCCCCYA